MSMNWGMIGVGLVAWGVIMMVAYCMWVIWGDDEE